MIDHLRFIWQVLVFAAVMALAGMLLLPRMESGPEPGIYLAAVVAVTLINLVSWLVMARGIRSGDRDGTVYLLGGIGLKFFLYLCCFLAFWLVTKNLSKPFIVAFFALYLGFTFLLAINLRKLLINN